MQAISTASPKSLRFLFLGLLTMLFAAPLTAQQPAREAQASQEAPRQQRRQLKRDVQPVQEFQKQRGSRYSKRSEKLQKRMERWEDRLRKHMDKRALKGPKARPAPLIAIIIGVVLFGIWLALIAATISSAGVGVFIVFLILSIIWSPLGILGLLLLIGGIIGLVA